MWRCHTFTPPPFYNVLNEDWFCFNRTPIGTHISYVSPLSWMISVFLRLRSSLVWDAKFFIYNFYHLVKTFERHLETLIVLCQLFIIAMTTCVYGKRKKKIVAMRFHAWATLFGLKVGLLQHPYHSLSLDLLPSHLHFTLKELRRIHDWIWEYSIFVLQLHTLA